MAWQQSYNIATESIKLPEYVAWNIISTYIHTYINEDKYHTDSAWILITLLPMFRKLLLVGGFDMVQLIHTTNGPIYLAH